MKFEEIINFWFEEVDSSLWFNSTAEFDLQLKQRFESVYQEALKGTLDHWGNSPDGALALIVLLDQFPLNMYRGKPESFSGEKKAQSIAREAVAKKFDEQLTDAQKAFMYMPLMHSEDMNDQDFSVSLYEKAGLKQNLRFAKHHRKIVRKFGRFPHRNSILGRESTVEEIAYLNSREAFHG